MVVLGSGRRSYFVEERRSKIPDFMCSQRKPVAFGCEATSAQGSQTNPKPAFTQHLPVVASLDRARRPTLFPAWLTTTSRNRSTADDTTTPRPNLTAPPHDTIADHLGAGVEDLFYHVLGTFFTSPEYRKSQTPGPSRLEWPRIPLPALAGWATREDATEQPRKHQRRGAAKLAGLLNSETPVAGVTEGDLRPELAASGSPRHP